MYVFPTWLFAFRHSHVMNCLQFILRGAGDGLSFTLKFLVRNFRLGTASRFCLLAKHRSGVSTHTSAMKMADSPAQQKSPRWGFILRGRWVLTPRPLPCTSSTIFIMAWTISLPFLHSKLGYFGI
jgi:hypothetical protein